MYVCVCVWQCSDFLFATGLHPGKRYQVRVLAATSKGWPIQADEFEWKLLEMPNYGAAANVPEAPTVHLTVVNSTSIEVSRLHWFV